MPQEKPQTRYMREYQARRRGGKTYKSTALDAPILIAVASGELGESAAAKVLGIDIVELRGRVNDSINEALVRFLEWREKSPPLVNDRSTKGGEGG